MIEVYEVAPQGFNHGLQVSACYVHVGEKVLFLLRSSHKAEGNRWGVPGGKLERSETPAEGARRELGEETGICVQPAQIRALGAIYFRKPEVDYVFHQFVIELDAIPHVLLNEEHSERRWVTGKEALLLPLMHGGVEALRFYSARKG